MTTQKPVSLRLNDQDKANAKVIVASGAAKDLTGAVRLSLALVARRIVKL